MAAKDDSTSAQHNKFALFTHRMKESLGLAEKTTANETVRELAKRIDTFSDELKTLVKVFQKITSSMKDISEAGNELTSAITDCQVAHSSDMERINLSGCASKTAEFERIAADCRLKVVSQIDTEVIGTLKAILDGEVRDGKAAKAQYDSARVDLSNAQTKLAAAQKTKQQTKIDAAQLELDSVKKRFDSVEKETMLKLEDSIAVCQYKIIETMIHFVECHKSYYNRGYQILSANSLDIADYRRYVEDTRKTVIAKTKPNRLTLRLSLAPKVSKKKIFGASLEELESDGRSIDGVPIFFLSCIVYIEQWGLEEEGVFRTAGSHSMTEAIRAQIEHSGGDYEWPATGEKILTATDLLKQFLRELPQPLLGSDLCNQIMKMKPTQDVPAQISAMQTVISKLPTSNQRMLKLLFGLLNKVSTIKANRMSPVALATCMGPNINAMNFGPDVDPFEMTAQLNGLVAFIIQHSAAVFENVTQPISAPNSPRTVHSADGNPGLMQIQASTSGAV